MTTQPITPRPIPSKTPILGICTAASGIGKTTLLTRLIPLLIARGLRISVIKHAHHHFDIDQPGKDSYRLREAGSVQTLIGSRKRWALITELARAADHDVAPDVQLAPLLAQLDESLADLILVEGFREAAIPKIEVYRPGLNPLLLAHNDAHIIAVASDGAVQTPLPLLDLNNPAGIAAFIMDWYGQSIINPRQR